MASHDHNDIIRDRLRDERGTIVREAPEAIALVYPSPYSVGMSSLGFQTIYSRIHRNPSRAAHRAFLPDDVPAARAARQPVITYEGRRSIANYGVIAFSVAYEMELEGVIHCLELSGISAEREKRSARDPLVIAGGPLTFSNPLPLAPYVDAIVMGEADTSIVRVLDAAFAAGDKAEVLRALADMKSVYVPSVHGDEMPAVDKASDEELPAYSQIITPNTELRSMFLIEPERGCHRGCEYCVMRRSTNDGMRTVSIERVLELIPEGATRVGLVGAATTDHPKIADLVEAIADRGLEAGLSSLRADRLNDRLVAALRRAGARGLTTASDGASQRLRDKIQRRAPEDVLLRAAHLARDHGLKRMKLYMMVGLPTETNDDIDELIEFAAHVSTVIPLSLGIAPFVAKRNTPLDGEPYAGIDIVDGRLKRLRSGLKGKVDVRATSARWAWVEYVLAQGGQAEGRAVLDAVRRGGRFGDWKAAFESLPAERPTRALVRPGDKLGRARALRVV